ncbi:1,4-alpha-glucan branching protein GlgB [Blastococcus sp. MG754426]|uniref:1,4-alpha-glucan branching protein GlgB n=1 Tax=unclassified Blastococcus TaxID=2619396 RepID=UPI001EF00A51|nr:MULTISPECIES: 1,4-alpha-glucan branching protein GlgB [unclassified Blastococcus]MCF6505928.1 1,4-alpha-glucan branching protein GlgB [Blastococcus sp. MG754426]MCF6510685.1 1,4-alpha-glucan branching protein GlgB [Blastococcus sp. MG754427]
MTTDDRGDSPVAGKDDLQRAVEEKVAQAEAAAGSEPPVNAEPAKKTTKRAAAKKAAPAKKAAAAKKAAPAKKTAPAKKAATADAATGTRATAAKRSTAKKAAAAPTATEATPEPGSEDTEVTANPVVAPAPIAEPGDGTGAPAGQPVAPDPDPATPPTPQAPDEDRAGSAEPAAPVVPADVSPADAAAPAGGTTAGAAGDTGVEEFGEEDLRAIVEGWSRDPHRILGAHRTAEGWAVRTLRPDAVSVAVLDEDGSRHEAGQLHGGGIYEATLPRQPGDYRIEVVYGDGQGGTTTHTVDDPFRWLPTLGPVDEHLIREGRHERLWEVLGAHVRRYETPRGTVEGVSFAVWAPSAQGVKVTGDFDYWQARAYPMRMLGSSGVWEIFVPGVQVGTRYRYHVLGADGTWREKADPLAFATEVPPLNASVVTESTYEWADDAWLEQRAEAGWHQRPMSVYEVHAGSWRQGLSYREMADQLVDYVRDAGFTHIEFMPLAEHPFGGSWGYQVTSYYAPTSRYGTPDDLRYLIDRAHQAGIGVIVDWVPAHFPKDEWALARFDGTSLYEHGDPRRGEQLDWGTYVFDFGRSEVRNFLVANALYWCKEFHVDGIRVDAVASMLYLDYSRSEWVPNQYGGRENLEAVAFLQEFNATVYREVPGVVTIAEESTAWPGVTRPTHLGGLGFGFKWNMGWMHDSLSYVEREPIYRSYHHGQLTFSMHYAYSENYVLPISHDEVVYGKGSMLRKMPGDRWQQLANLRAYLAYMWAHPGKQLLFMGSEFAQDSEWAESRSLDWWHLDDPAHRGMLQLVTDLNGRYKECDALWSQDVDPAGFQWIDANDASGNVLSFLRYGAAPQNASPAAAAEGEEQTGAAEGSVLACVVNFSGAPHHEYRIGLPRPGQWREVLNTDAEGYGGSGVGNYGGIEAEPEPWHGQPYSATISAPPLGTVWFLHEG